MSFLQTDIRAYFDVEAQIVAGDGTARQVLVPEQLVNLALNFPIVANSDVIDHHVQITAKKGGVEVVIGAITIAAGVGTQGASPPSVGALPFGGPSGPQPFGPGVEFAWRVEEAVTLTNAVTLQMSVASF